MSRITTKKLAANVVLSVGAQLVSLITSFVLGFIVPKYIDGLSYSYWQMYVLYVSYVGVLHFGLLDGMVLRYSQYDYDELDKARIRSQFQLLLIFSSIVTILSCAISALVLEGVSLVIVVLVSAGVVTKNIFTYTSYTFQLTNRISRYAFLVIAQRAVYAVVVVILLSCGVGDFYWYCIADLLGDVVGIIIGAVLNRGMYFGKSLPVKECFKEGWSNISAGIFLMIANLSSTLLIGGAKMVIQWRWDELVFGKLAFSFSVTNIFLTFVTAISVVLFPSLKRMQNDELPSLYPRIRLIASVVLFTAMIAYFPMTWVLNRWLPQYAESLPYLGILLPLIVFSSKVGLLTNNYLKAYRKERIMLLINVLSVAVGMGLFALCAYVFSDMELLLYSVVFIVMARSVASEIVVFSFLQKALPQDTKGKRMRVLKFALDFVIEFIMSAAFIVVVKLTSLWLGCLIYFGMLVAYYLINGKGIAAMLKKFFKKHKKEGDLQ